MNAASPYDITLRSAEVTRFWPDAEPYLKECLDRDEYTLFSVDDLRRAIVTGHMDLWIVYLGLGVKGAFVTEIVSASKGRALNIIAFGGKEMPDWIEIFSLTMETFARREKCRYICEMGRKGWTKVLKSLGWIESSTVMLRLV